MYARDWRDVIAGGLLGLGGLAIAAYAVTHYSLGTLQHMGPGMFPAATGVVLLVLGVVIAVPALFRAGTLQLPDTRNAAAIIGSVAAFAIVLPMAGLVPAILALVLISSLAAGGPSLKTALVLWVFLSGIAYLVFIALLGVPVSMIRGFL